MLRLSEFVGFPSVTCLWTLRLGSWLNLNTGIARLDQTDFFQTKGPVLMLCNNKFLGKEYKLRLCIPSFSVLETPGTNKGF